MHQIRVCGNILLPNLVKDWRISQISKMCNQWWKSGSEWFKVASCLRSLIYQLLLTTIACFISVYHLHFCLLKFSTLKMICYVTKVSGHTSRHVSARIFIVNEHLKRLKVVWSVDPEFRELFSRKQTHNEIEKKCSLMTFIVHFLMIHTAWSKSTWWRNGAVRNY